MPVARAFRKQAGGSEETFRAQSNVENAVGALTRSILMNGNLIEDVQLSTTPVLVEHKLGRASRGYIVCKSNAAASVYTAPTTESASLFENLAASTTVVVSIWFF
jgi:hypothetical protein